MRRFAPRIVSIAALVGIAVSAWLLVQYLLPPSASACGPGGGCNRVRFCWLAQIGTSVFPFWPTVGVLAFAGLLILSLTDSTRLRRFLPIAGYAAVASGLFLLVGQRIACKAFCPFCVVTDLSAIVGGGAAVMSKDAIGEVVKPIWRWVFGVLAVGAVVAPFGWGFATTSEAPVQGVRVANLPAPVAHEQRPAVATIVEFADFECPFCRRQHLELMQTLPAFGPRVRLVRKHVPLSMHEHAEGAARAACCAEEQGRGDEMADALFRNDDIDEAGCAHHAEALHLDMTRYRECLHADRTDARLASDRSDATASEVHGLPTMYIGHMRYEGVVMAPEVRAAIEEALHSGG